MKKKSFKNKVVLRFFSYYMLILMLVLLGIYYILHFELRNKFIQMHENETNTSIEHLATILDTEFLNLYHIDRTLSENPTIIDNKMNSDNYYNYIVQQELNKFAFSSSLVQDIVYIDKMSDYVYGSIYHYNYDNETLEIRLTPDITTSLPIQKLESAANSFIRIENPSGSLLFFIPEQNSYTFQSLILIDQLELEQLLKTVSRSNTIHLNLVDANNELILGSIEPGTFQEFLDQGSYMMVNCKYVQMKILSVYDNSYFEPLITDTFQKSYLILLAVVIFILIVIIILTHYSYAPLKLFAHILHESNLQPDATEEHYLDLEYAGKIIQSVKYENDQLLEKIENYRISIQKTLLSTTVPLSEASQMNLDNIDTLFHSENDMNIFVIRFAIQRSVDSETFYELLANHFTQALVLVPLNISNQGLTYLVGSPSKERCTPESLSQACDSLSAKYQCSYATSRISNNPLDIPRLFEELMIATHTITPDRSSTYELLDIFKEQLEDSNFTDAKHSLHALLNTLNSFSYLEFFTQSLLIDALTAIVSLFSKHNIEFTAYSDTYYQTLYLSRSTDYSKEHEAITDCFLSLIQTLEKKQVTLVLNKETFTQYVEQEFTNSSLSINQVGDYFQVSGSYISYWFKKNFDKNFSDYLWNLRFEYALELMKDSSLNMAEISEKIGYDNYSSFRRKFKNHCGVSPSEYREQH